MILYVSANNFKNGMYIESIRFHLKNNKIVNVSWSEADFSYNTVNKGDVSARLKEIWFETDGLKNMYAEEWLKIHHDCAHVLISEIEQVDLLCEYDTEEDETTEQPQTPGNLKFTVYQETIGYVDLLKTFPDISVNWEFTATEE